jgi:hypothetical protein
MKTANRKPKELTPAAVADLEGVALYAAFKQAKAIMSAQQAVINAVKGKVAPLLDANGGKLAVFVDEAGLPRGFEHIKTKGSVSVREMEKTLAARGMTATEITEIKAESRGPDGKTFSTF